MKKLLKALFGVKEEVNIEVLKDKRYYLLKPNLYTMIYKRRKQKKIRQQKEMEISRVVLREVLDTPRDASADKDMFSNEYIFIQERKNGETHICYSQVRNYTWMVKGGGDPRMAECIYTHTKVTEEINEKTIICNNNMKFSFSEYVKTDKNCYPSNRNFIISKKGNRYLMITEANSNGKTIEEGLSDFNKSIFEDKLSEKITFENMEIKAMSERLAIQQKGRRLKKRKKIEITYITPKISKTFAFAGKVN